jgi:hypothetical protein
MTQCIPPRFRGVTLLVGTVVLFPLIVGVIMLDALTHEMPRVRTPLKKALLAVFECMHAGSRIFRVKRASSSVPFTGMVQEQTSLAS